MLTADTEWDPSILDNEIEEEEESVRVSVIPAFYGEKVVMRLMTNEMQNAQRTMHNAKSFVSCGSIKISMLTQIHRLMKCKQ